MQLTPRAFLTGLAAAALVTSTTALAQDTGWAHLSPWTPENTNPTDGFGEDVCIEGEWAFMGSNGQNRVDIWRRTGATWSFFQTLESPVLGEALFGMRLEIEDGVLYAAQPFSDLGGNESGAILTFEFDGAAWVHSDTILDKFPNDFDYFGRVLDVSGDWMATVANVDDSTVVHVLCRQNGTWDVCNYATVGEGKNLDVDLAIHPNPDGETATLFFSDIEGTGEIHCRKVFGVGALIQPSVLPDFLVVGSDWGRRIEFDGEHLVVASPNALQPGGPTGSVAIYDVDTSADPIQVTHAQTVYPDASQIDCKFGLDLELEDGRLVIGAQRYRANEVQQPGAIFVYRPDVFFNGWSLEALLLQEGAAHGSEVGYSV
ncbi:MAG: hypothetical protein ACYS26_12080, partial [Planctomycetota bacterium]